MALQTGARDGHEEVIDYLLAQGADPNVCGTDWPLKTAVDYNRPSFVQKYLAHGADPKLAMQGLLAHAAWHGYIDVVKVMVESGKVDINEQHSNGLSAVTASIKNTQPDVLDYLLAKGADPNGVGDGLPVVWAAWAPEEPRMLEAVLKAGADPNVLDQHTYNPLVVAAWHGRLESVKLLLKNGAKQDIVGWKGLSPMVSGSA